MVNFSTAPGCALHRESAVAAGANLTDVERFHPRYFESEACAQ